jgi:type II secretion system protein N
MVRGSWKTWVGYGLFTSMAMLMCVYWTFPADIVADKAISQLRASTQGLWNITYEEASMHRLTGLRLDGVTVHKGPLKIPLQSLRARVLLLPFFTLKWGVGVDLHTENGHMYVAVKTGSKTGSDVFVEADHFNINNPLWAVENVGLSGFLSGTAEFHMPTLLPNAEGRGEFSVEQFGVGPGSVQGFSFPKLEFGNIETSLAMKNAVLKTNSFKQSEADVALKAHVSVTVRPHTEMSPVEACLHVKPSGVFLSKNPKMQTVMQLAEMQIKKDSQGFLNVPLYGMLGSVSLRPGYCQVPAGKNQ